MRVVEVYTEGDLNRILCDSKRVDLIMNKFFSRFPLKYRENYDKNLKSLEMWIVDESYIENIGGEYFEEFNIMLLKSLDSIIHELMHVASCDHITRISAFQRKMNGDFFENALIEGMTEYCASLALEEGPSDYIFETFVASMLTNIDSILEYYFIPNYKEFINLFPNKKDILSLMYSLSFYTKETDKEDLIINKDVKTRMDRVIKNVIDSLINIQLSFNMDRSSNYEYSDKFMELITSDIMEDYLGMFSSNYKKYARNEINKRVLRRIV